MHKNESKDTKRGAEVFCGSAGISQEICSITQYTVEAYDILDGPGGDITNDAVFDNMLKRIRSGVFAFLRFGIQCNTYASARRNDGKGPGPLGSDDGLGLYGLPGLNAGDKAAVDNANLMTHRACMLIRAAIYKHILRIVENPYTGRLWRLPIFR